MNEDRRIGQRAGIRWAIAMLRKLSQKMPDPDSDLLKAAAHILTIEARAIRNEDADGWQDIATAPRDGRRVLTWGRLHDDGAVDMGETAAVRLSFWDDDGWYNEDVGGHEPTHWMSLPAGPDTDDITAGLEALSEPIVAEWGEVKDRLSLGKEDA